jgi:hypothetical protein
MFPIDRFKLNAFNHNYSPSVSAFLLAQRPRPRQLTSGRQIVCFPQANANVWQNRDLACFARCAISRRGASERRTDCVSALIYRWACPRARSLYSVAESIDQPAFGRDCRAVDDIRRLSLVQTDSATAKLDDFRLEFTLNGISQRCQSRKPTSPLAITGHLKV